MAKMANAHTDTDVLQTRIFRMIYYYEHKHTHIIVYLNSGHDDLLDGAEVGVPDELCL